ncbi:hypothetical protein SAMN05518672_11449 [Chitinophaga sp. CF118]|uniref:hypothetical protein n=1 Tax=Chitinophaga sp. CF118 TaxID=1884367 RepID=UPI0008EDF823|nr:hypothetical protein [Chitinophaga sp. CF118]SFF01294.1 hypothetical protein SAMN05518672_11449 [Chitinophaga sp. CF118]
MMYVPQSSRQACPDEQVFYSLISKDPVLSHFLETGNMQTNAHFTANKLYKDPDFLHFIAPFYEQAFTAAIIQCFNTGNTGMMSDITGNPILLDDGYQEKSYCTILDYLQEKQQKLLSIWNDLQLKNKIDTTELKNLASPTSISLLNYLPDEFEGFRSEYCNELVKLTRLLVRTDYDMAHELIINTLELHCLPQSRQRATICFQELQNIEEHAKPTGINQRPTFILLRLIAAMSKK